MNPSRSAPISRTLPPDPPANRRHPTYPSLHTPCTPCTPSGWRSRCPGPRSSKTQRASPSRLARRAIPAAARRLPGGRAATHPPRSRHTARRHGTAAARCAQTGRDRRGARCAGRRRR
eukprot:361431-Chlamydomonas_euryale.AAC.4